MIIISFVLGIVWVVLGYLGAPLWLWTLSVGAILASLPIPWWGWSLFGLVAVILNIPWLRRSLITSVIVKTIQRLKLLPTISKTEREAIEAGTVWVDGEFFTGQPNFTRLRSEPYPQVSPELQAFLDGPVETVCQMASDWEIYQRKDLPTAVWDYLKQERFLGMMIPVEYGGLGYSNFAYSTVMMKLASRSFTHVATVGVTNSLGPGKLLLRYGTEDQKNYYLPRLAKGEEIPCFALTEPHAGSDAASIQSAGVVFEGKDGKRYLRLNWQKRYITLGAIATLLGLAFRLKDPDNLLGKGEDVGITCALIPANTPGVDLQRRHDPMGVPFYNSPTTGHDVILSVDQIIGGVDRAGQGWMMLMQCLAAGRGISFPAATTGIAKLVARVTSAYGVVRQQFGLSIGRFEGIEEPLARIGGLTYLMEAARRYTCGAVDAGEQPSVVSAIAKYHFTELTRQLVCDGMDILGGSGICRGPRNLLANIYTAMPIAITVEGANILTRTLMIFGQGVIRSHPYVYQEITALNQGDLKTFDHALWHHFGLIVRHGFRAGLLNVTRGMLVRSPVSGPTAPYYRKLSWASATFALLTEVAMITFGGNLKRQEKLTGRYADILSWLYLGSATLRRFEAEGQHPTNLPYVHWAMQYCLAQIQQALIGIFTNLPVPLSGVMAAWMRMNSLGTMPSDRLGHQVAHRLQTVRRSREALTEGIYLPTDTDEALARLEQAFNLAWQADPIAHRMKAASHNGQLPQGRIVNLIDLALAAKVITSDEATVMHQAEASRNEAIQVDSFSSAEYRQVGRSSDLPHHNELNHSSVPSQRLQTLR